MSQVAPFTLTFLLERAQARLGSRVALLRTLFVSRQRLYSAEHGGPPLRADRLVLLALIAGVDPIAALWVGGQSKLAALLDETLWPRWPSSISPEQRRHLRDLDGLPRETREVVVKLVAAMASSELAPTSDSASPLARLSPHRPAVLPNASVAPLRSPDDVG